MLPTNTVIILHLPFYTILYHFICPFLTVLANSTNLKIDFNLSRTLMRNRTILQVGKRLNCFNVCQTQFNHFTCFGIQQLREMMTLEGRWDRKKYIRDNKINFYNNFSTKIESASFPELRNDLQHKNEVKERSYVILYRQQLAHLRSTNNPEATVNLFSEMKQTGLPLPGKLYEEVFLALNASNRFQQVESMYLEMRRDKIIPSVNCFYIRLQVRFLILLLEFFYFFY